MIVEQALRAALRERGATKPLVCNWRLTSPFWPEHCPPPRDGAVAQLGERLVRNEEVRGSIPLSSTIPPKHLYS